MKLQTHERGFTLVEVILTMVLLMVVLGISYRIFLSQAEAHKTQFEALMGQQGLRAAMESIARDVKSAGYPFKDQLSPENLSSWIPGSFIPKIPQQTTPSGIITITSGGENFPDVLSILLVLSSETNPSTLAQGALAGDTFIRLTLSGTQTNDQFNVSDIIFIGKPGEMAQVKGISGNSLIIDSDPDQPGNQGLKKGYVPGTTVSEVSLVSYAVFNDANDPNGLSHEKGISVLKRKINACGFEPLVEQIAELKINPVGAHLYRIQLSILKDSISDGRSKLLTMNTKVMVRN